MMKKLLYLVILAVSVIFFCHQQAYAISITATPQSPVFGPNDWITVNLDIQGYNGGPVSWVAHRPDNSTISGNLTDVKSTGMVTQQIIRNAFDNYFGNWSIDYTYDGVEQAASFKVSSLGLTVLTDKSVYYEPDMMQINITTAYYVPIARQAEFFRLNFYDQGGNVVKNVPEIDVRATQHSTVYSFHMTQLADYDPPGLYKLKVQYYNTVITVPFLLDKYTNLMQVSANTDKASYEVGDAVEMKMLFTRVTQSNGTLKITDPLRHIVTRLFHVHSVNTSFILTNITNNIGRYEYTVQYAGVGSSGSFAVVANPQLLPNIGVNIFLDKLNYRPGDIIRVKVHVSQLAANSTSIWVVDPNGIEYPRQSLPTTTVDTILPHKIGRDNIPGQWNLYIDYDGIVRSAAYNVQGQPLDDSELLNSNKFSMPVFVSNFAANLTSPTGIAVDSDGYVYVADSGSSQVKKFDPSGNLVLSFGDLQEGNHLRHPNGIVVGDHFVYVVDTGHARIDMFNKDNGTFVYSWGSYGDSPGMFHIPIGLARDSQGDFLVADIERDAIEMFDSNFTFTNELRSPLTIDSNFTGARGIAVDSSGNIYLSSTNNTILEFSSSGNFVNFFGSKGTEDGRFNRPTAIATDQEGNFYVADTGNHRIQKFDSYGDFILSWGTEGNSTGQFEEPVGLAIDRSDNIYVVDKKNNDIQKFSLHGTVGQAIPSWVKDRAAWWSEGALSKRDFALAVTYLVYQGLPTMNENSETSVVEIPNWVKQEAGWWASGQIDDETFVKNLQYLISAGILKI